MIKNQWYVILESCEVSAKKPLNVTRLNLVLTHIAAKQPQIIQFRSIL